MSRKDMQQHVLSFNAMAHVPTIVAVNGRVASKAEQLDAFAGERHREGGVEARARVAAVGAAFALQVVRGGRDEVCREPERKVRVACGCFDPGCRAVTAARIAVVVAEYYSLDSPAVAPRAALYILVAALHPNANANIWPLLGVVWPYVTLIDLVDRAQCVEEHVRPVSHIGPQSFRRNLIHVDNCVVGVDLRA